MLSGPGLAELDLSLFKNIAFTERIKLQIRSEFFNALNHAELRNAERRSFFPAAQISSTAGLITSTATTSRQIQFGMKLTF